ncbi:ABC transporter permease [Halobellus sp. EA9]|uniref:ABC transporter permease n=1 Tax=Halobellus sp. EA9 TaxID=3421647 RepID=UPI003EBF9702
MVDYLGFVLARWRDLLDLTIQHARIVGISIAIAIVIGISIGTLITFNDRAASIVLWLAGISMTVPSIALFGLLIPVLGIGAPPVIFSLVLYSQLPLIRNTYVGLTEVDEASIKVGRGMGMTKWEQLRYVQLPNALPVIMSGLRNAVVIIVGVAAIGAFIGAGGLGDFIFDGIRTRDIAKMVVTTIVLSAMALTLDYGFGVAEQLLRLRNGEDINRARVTDVIWEVAV